MATVVAIEPDYDTATHHIRVFRERYVYSDTAFTALPPRHVLIRCVGQDATPATVIPTLQNAGALFVAGSGHGRYAVYKGYEGVTLLSTTTVDTSIVGGKIIHLLACRVGALLGPACIQRGARAFWGYSIQFIFPVNDEAVEERFLHMDALVDRGILAGYPPREIYRIITDYFWRLFEYLQRINDPITAARLMDNFSHLVCPAVTWGDPDAILV